MDFAKRQLLKYGWEEGKGLGKNESGISEALKPTLKFDTTGIGHDNSEQFTFNWWENVYNQAADNINVMKSDDGSVQVKLSTDESIDINTKKYSTKNLKKNKLEYGCFVKTSKLTPSGVVDYEDKIKATTDDIVENVKVSNMTDEELFAACGGRTAHKGARHGLKLNGKLARIEEQEMLLLQRMKQEANNLNPQDINSIPNEYEQKKKKTKKKRETDLDIDPMIANLKKRKHCLIDSKDSENNEEIDIQTAQMRTEYYISKKEKRRKKHLNKIQKKKINKITNMLENVSVSNRQENKDDGFEEKKTDEDDSPKKKSKKKRKLNPEESSEKDDGFEEYISEVNEKLMYYKELRKDLQKQKRIGDENRICKMAEEFEKKL